MLMAPNTYNGIRSRPQIGRKGLHIYICDVWSWRHGANSVAATVSGESVVSRSRFNVRSNYEYQSHWLPYSCRLGLIPVLLISLLEQLQSRFGDKLVKFQVVSARNGAAVLKGLNARVRRRCLHSYCLTPRGWASLTNAGQRRRSG